jgi:hypothetical protein
VGFRFIPFFNFYWEFVAVKGLAEDMGRYARASIGIKPIPRGLTNPVDLAQARCSRGIGIKPIPRGLTLAYCILMIVSIVLQIVMVFIVAFFVFRKADSAWNRIPDHLQTPELFNRIVANAQQLTQQLAGILGFLISIPGGVVLLILFKKIADASAAIAEAKLAAVPVDGTGPAHDGTVRIVTAVSAGLAIVGKIINKGH